MDNVPPKVRRLTVDAAEAEQRLDNFLFRQLKGVPKGHVYRLLRTGQVRVNSRRVKPDYRLTAGDEIRLPPVRQAEPVERLPPGSRQLEALKDAILFEDEQLLVINKPAGMAVHGGSGVSCGVIEALRASRPEARSLELVHRLDRETSGCLLVAKKRSALRTLHAALREGRVEKHYLALLAGAWPGGERQVRLALEKNVLQSGERMVRVAEEGKDAESHFRPLRRFAAAVLVDIAILTGRTHQIRVHAAHLGHAVLGDDKYGDREANKSCRALGLKRMFLHAHSLAFNHPAGGAPLRVTAPLDANLQAVLERLENAD
ncbi:MAG: 23S rRNA pseudouridine(955/2504/2580) synthase RluC [Gammaproteobacteria bacterium]|nr:23S rRNA pseudouridine(955/2504/2580) synthase RluC [Gammaproteobacteria bacterium]